MATAQIVAQYVNQPQAGKKQGTIKTPDGVYYGVAPAMLPQFQPGGTYAIEYETRTWQGKEYYTIRSATAVAAIPPGSGPAGKNQVGMKDPEIAQQVFVGICIKALGSQIQLSEEALDQAVAMFRNVWNRHWAAGQKQSRDDMNDEIPF